MYKYDLSVPLEHFYKIVEAVRDHLQGFEFNYVNGFGHLGKKLF